jgi:hypothetical protein
MQRQLGVTAVTSALVVLVVALALSEWTKPAKPVAPVAPVTHRDSFEQRFAEDGSTLAPRVVRTERVLPPVAEAASPEPRSASRVGGTADICQRHGMMKVWVSKTRWRCRRQR